MKYTVSNTINKPINEVVTKFKDPAGVQNWMEGIQTVELISGTPGDVGTERDMHFLHKNKAMTIRETILESGPAHMKFSYVSPMGTNIVNIRFEENADGSTAQINDTEMQVSGFMKIMTFLFKGMFKKQSMKYLNAFKQFAEK